MATDIFEVALREHVLGMPAIANLISDRLYVGYQQQGDVRQENIVVTRIAGTQTVSHSGHSGQETALFQFDVRSTCQLKCLQLASYIERRLRPQFCVPVIGTTHATQCGYVERRGRADMGRDKDTNMVRTMLDFFFLYEVQQ